MKGYRKRRKRLEKEIDKIQKEKEALLNEKKEAVCNLLKIGLAKEKVAEAMKLSVEEVEIILQKNLKLD